MALGSVTLADTNSNTFNPLHHLAGISPYFTPNDPQLDPSVPQGCNVTRAAYLARHAAIYANDFDYERYLEPFIQKLQNTTQDWSKAGSLSFLSKWSAPITEAHLEKITRVGLQGVNHVWHQCPRQVSRLPNPKECMDSNIGENRQDCTRIYPWIHRQ